MPSLLIQLLQKIKPGILGAGILMASLVLLQQGYTMVVPSMVAAQTAEKMQASSQPTQSNTQSPQATETQVDAATMMRTGASLQVVADEPVHFEPGQPAVIPFVLFTNGQEVDGLQVVARFSGVEIAESSVQVNEELGLLPVFEEMRADGFNLMLIPREQSQPFVAAADVRVFSLQLVPKAAGALTISFDQENTLVPKHGTAQNILEAPAEVTVALEGTPEARFTTGSGAVARAVSNPVMLGIGFLVIFGVVAAVWFGLKKVRAEKQERDTANESQFQMKSDTLPENKKTARQLQSPDSDQNKKSSLRQR